MYANEPGPWLRVFLTCAAPVWSVTRACMRKFSISRTEAMSISAPELTETLRCPACVGQLSSTRDADEDALVCSKCGEKFPVIRSIPRLLLAPFREALLGNGTVAGTDERQLQTALSFGFEWTRFPEMYDEWGRSVREYMQPDRAEFFRGKKVLDAGCGNGRFAHYAAKYGAEVWAMDLGPAVEIARRNTEQAGVVQVAQADLHQPPFAPESFDFIYSIGVLHHLPDPEAAFQK